MGVENYFKREITFQKFNCESKARLIIYSIPHKKSQFSFFIWQDLLVASSFR